MLFKIFVILFLIAAAYKIGRAYFTGTIQFRGESEPLRRQDKPDEFKSKMGIITVIFALLVIMLAWIFLVPLLHHSK